MANRILGPIIGGLTDTHVNLWARCDGPARLHAWLSTDPDFSQPRRAGFSPPLRANTGYAGQVAIDGLKPETTYYYALTFSGQPPAAPEGRFTTLPPAGVPRSFRFAFGSCFLPTRPESGETFRRMEALRAAEDWRFLLMLGDQIYADAPQGNGLGRVALTLEDYRAVYAWNFSRPPLRQLWRNLPVYMMMDDHEVDDDWRWQQEDCLAPHIPVWDRFIRWTQREAPLARRLDRRRVLDALQAYWEHQAMHAPPSILPAREGQLLRPGGFAYTFTVGGAAFFVLDVRTRRIRGRKRQQMLDEAQWQALEDWLLAVRDDFPVKFIVSSSAVIFRFRMDIAADRWPGYPAERRRLLSLLARHGVENVFLLTGDLHTGYAISGNLYGPQGRAIPVWEFCATPFEQQANFVTRWVRLPEQDGPLHHTRLHFNIPHWNFGVVEVNLDDPARPAVRFDLHYKTPQGWQIASVSNRQAG